MRFTRRLTTLTILVLYAVQLVGAHPLHLGDCSSELASHCQASLGGSSDCNEDPGHDHAGGEDDHARGEDRASHAGNLLDACGSHGPGSETPQRHDSSRCKLCRVLGQAQQPAAGLGFTCVIQAAPASSERAPNLYLAPRRSGFQSRAPPVV